MTILEPICVNCKHFDFDKIGCAAFPGQNIPNEILNGDNDHSRPLPDQKNDLVFEKRPTDD